MSNKKVKKKKNIKTKNIELRNLRTKVIELENKIKNQKKENFKQLNIRNLKIFLGTFNFFMPFVLSTCISINVLKFLSGDDPFKLDDIENYKSYNLEYEIDGSINIEEFYAKDVSLLENELVIYTPFELKDNQYIRYKREYEIEELTSLDLYNAVLNNNYEYIMDNLKEYHEEKEVVNSIEHIEENDYIIQASLHMLDEEDILKYKETDFENGVTMAIDFGIGLVLGAIIAYKRKFKYPSELRKINKDYRYHIETKKQMENELETVNEKILSLTRKDGSNR